MKVRAYIELEVEIDASYSLRRPAPMVQDHDHPGYSDPGDDEETEIKEVHFIILDEDGKSKLVKVPDELMEYVCDTISDEVTSECRAQYENDHRISSIK